jgi:DNA modification methylase
MPESVHDRASSKHEYVFLLVRQTRYWFSLFDVNPKYPGDLWTVPTALYPQGHFVTYPVTIPLRCIAMGCQPGGMVLDPFSGAATTGLAALHLGRRYTGIDINPAYHDLAKERLSLAAQHSRERDNHTAQNGDAGTGTPPGRSA